MKEKHKRQCFQASQKNYVKLFFEYSDLANQMKVQYNKLQKFIGVASEKATVGFDFLLWLVIEETLIQ